MSSGLVYHFVGIKFLDSLPQAKITEICSKFTALAETCRDPNGERYIVAIHAGSNNSPENSSGGISHAFIVIFKDLADRDYYVFRDPEHDSFKLYLAEFITPDGSFRVVDFQDGQV
ncbi:stress responsive A/B barrel domain-containing protein [Tirmania nivea]|nr:stress responsive A/B barrel domain-containing protein [Tirmania nivea]